MRVIAYPHNNIAYIESFYEAVTARNVEVVTGIWSGRWILDNVRKGDVLHIHWPSFLYKSSGKRLVVLYSFFRFICLLLIARGKGAAIAWTAHNLFPHNRSVIPAIDRLGRIFVILLSTRIFAHSEKAKDVLIEEFPAANRKCRIIPHGNWIGRYGPIQGKLRARSALGLNDSKFVCLAFGQCKPYKNLTNLIKAFRQVMRDQDRLVIAGEFSSDVYLAEIKDAADGDRRIVLEPRFIPDADVATYFAAADILSMPYTEILTSGTAMLAISYGRPVLSVNRGFLRDVISTDVGILIEPGDDSQLEGALRHARRATWNEDLIMAKARMHTFKAAAKIFINETGFES